MLIPLQHGSEGCNPLVHIWSEEGRIRGKFADFSGPMSIQGELTLRIGASFKELKNLDESAPLREKGLPRVLSGWPELALEPLWSP